MTDKRKIIVLDDEADLARRWADGLKKLPGLTEGFPEIVSLDGAAFSKEFEVLRERQASCRTKKAWTSASVFDQAAVLLVDYDLVGVLGTKLYTTGEEVSYLVRCFSNCGVIVGLNFEPGNRFDLTLRNHPDSFADLHIPAVQVTNSALWGLGAADFRPWSWPELPQQSAAYSAQVADALKNLDKPICEVLGFPRDVVASFPRSVAEYLGGFPAKTTFRALATEAGLKEKDSKWATDQMLARISAARVSKWIESIVLPGQDILVDAPHLIWRYPSLLKADSAKVDSWNALCAISAPTDKLGIDHAKISGSQFGAKHWLSRPAWFWKPVSADAAIKEVSAPWETKTPPFVFCEDVSRFAEKSKSKEFVAEMESPYARRFVAHVEGINYTPRVRFAS